MKKPLIIIFVGLVIILAWILFPRSESTNQEEYPFSEDSSIFLPQPQKDSKISIEEALLKRRSVREYRDEPLGLQEVSQLLWAAQGITATSGLKTFRTAPSAGALYPLKVYIIGEIEGLVSGMYEYNPENHSIIKVKINDKNFQRELVKAAYEQTWIEEAPVNIIFTGNYEIIAQKYGKEKAPRYTHMEVGHAAQNVYLQAVSLNLSTVVVGGFEIEKIKEVLELPAEEEPLYIMPVGKIK